MFSNFLAFVIVSLKPIFRNENRFFSFMQATLILNHFLYIKLFLFILSLYKPNPPLFAKGFINL
jgi:hypothetical protein